MLKLKSLIFGILFCGFGLLATSQDTVPVGYYYKQHFIFNAGYWVYQDSSTGIKDSIALESVVHGFYGPNPVLTDFHEFYKVQYYSPINDSAYNDFFWGGITESKWRRAVG